jgi:glycosyltransferase involved in cell wall biosynthesis
LFGHAIVRGTFLTYINSLRAWKPLTISAAFNGHDEPHDKNGWEKESRGMKLAVVSSEYPPFHWGGVGAASHTLANQLALRGHEVHIFTRKHGMEPVKNHSNIRIHMVKWLKFPMAFALSFGKNAVPLVNAEGGFDAVIIFGNMTLMRKQDFRELSFPCLTKMCGTWAGERSALKFGDISLTSVSGANDLAVLKLSARYDKYEDYALTYSDAVIVECDNEINALNERMKGAIPIVDKMGLRVDEGPAGTISPLKDGFLGRRGNVFKQVQLIDMGLFSPTRRKDELRRKYVGKKGRLHLFVGRLAARKNVMEAARLFALHARARPDDRLLFIGKGNQESRIRKFAGQEGIQDKVHLVQNLGFSELADHYACADTFIFPSLWEGFGLVLLEALASGLPVVSRPVGGAPEVIVNGKNGFLYEKEEEAIRALEQCDGLDRDWIVKDVQKRFDLKRCIDNMEAACKRIASEGKSRSLVKA